MGIQFSMIVVALNIIFLINIMKVLLTVVSAVYIYSKNLKLLVNFYILYTVHGHRERLGVFKSIIFK